MIQIFGTKDCAPCITIRRYLDNKDIEYEYKLAEGEEYELLVEKATGKVSHPHMKPLVTDGKDIFTGLHWQELKRMAGIN